MENNLEKRLNLLKEKRRNEYALKSLGKYGSIVIQNRNGKDYIYLKKREGGRIETQYFGPYNSFLMELALKNNFEAKKIKKNIRRIDRELVLLGYKDDVGIPKDVLLSIDLARREFVRSIYNQSVLEGVGTTFPETEQILNNEKMSGISANDVLKILNLRNAWDFILDKDVISYPSDLAVLQRINQFVDEGLFSNAGDIRSIPVKIGGTNYVPKIPMIPDVKEELYKMIHRADTSFEDTAISLALYVMRRQLFDDGNKRTGIIFANHFLIAHGGGIMVVPAEKVEEFKKLLVDYYETNEDSLIRDFMKKECRLTLAQGEK